MDLSFEPIGVVTLRNAEGRIQARRLTVYRYARQNPASNEVAVPVAALGPNRELRVDLSRPLRGWGRHRGADAM